MGQQWVEIEKKEFDQIEPQITAEQMARAKFQIENPMMKRGMTTYDCPFNDPATGKCEIYNSRFIICAQYGVTSPIEDCNTDGDGTGTMVVNPILIYENLKDRNTMNYLGYLARDAKQTTIIDEFRRLLGL